MEYLSAVGLILGGFLILLVGGELLVKAAVSIASRLQISPAVIGLTIIAAGTSAPEMVTSFIASMDGAADVAMGNIVGSNIFNILAILGIAAIIKPNKVDASIAKIELPTLIIATIVVIVFVWDLNLARMEGYACMGILAVLFYMSVYRAKKVGYKPEEDEIETLKTPLYDAGFLFLGCVALVGGAQLALDGGIDLGKLFGLSERVIGITIISVGTGLPELATSAVAAYRGRNDIAIANVVGSNLVNTMGVSGVASMFKDLPVSSELAHFDSLLMLGVTFALLPIIHFGKLRIGRMTGSILSAAYVGYVIYLLSKESLT